MRSLAAALAALLLGPAAHAAEREPETVRVEGTADRMASDLTGFATTIRAEQFASRITTVADLLQEVAGLHVRSFGGLGSFATVSIRGSTAEQVNVYIDGVLLNPALGGGVNLADLALGNIESITIYRGFTPSHLDSGAIGGAIDIRTRRPAGSRAVSGSLSYGSLDTAEATALASWAGRGGPRAADGLLSLNATRTSGDFRFFDGNGTPFEAGDDGFQTRRNNRSWTADLLGRTGFGLDGGGRVDLQAGFTGRRQGVPGIDAFQSLTARSAMSRGLVKAAYERPGLLSGSLSLGLEAYYLRTAQRFQDRAGDTTGGLSTDTRNLMDAAGPSVLLRWHRPSAGWRQHYVSLLLSARRETARRTDRLNPVPDRGRAARLTYGLTAEDEIHLAGGRVVLVPSARWSRFASRFRGREGVPAPPAARDADARLAGKIGAAWHASSTITLRGNAGRFYRVPSFTEIFGDQGTVKGGDDLKPEEGWNYDLGFSWETGRSGPLERLRIQAALFRSDADNLIQFIQTSQSQVVARNTGRARVVGAEVSAAFGLRGGLGGGLEYTWQVARDRSDTFRNGSDLPGRPRHQASARASLTRPWGRPFYEFDYIGPNFFDPAAAALRGAGLSRDQLRVPGRYLHGVGFTRPAGRRLEFTVEVDNIFNVRTADVVRYPLPGRMVQARLRVRLP